MNSLFKTTIITTTFFLCSIVAVAQQQKRPVPGVSDNGYWVVESNVKTPKTNIIHFYTNNNELVYRETLEGVRLNTNRKKVRIKLQQVLETSLIAWQQNKKVAADMGYVKIKLK